jgi:hypothetical protein
MKYFDYFVFFDIFGAKRREYEIFLVEKVSGKGSENIVFAYYCTSYVWEISIFITMLYGP